MNSPGVHPRNLFESSVVSHLPVFPVVSALIDVRNKNCMNFRQETFYYDIGFGGFLDFV